MASFNLTTQKKQRLTKAHTKCSNTHCQHVRDKNNPLTVDHLVPKVIFNSFGFPDDYNHDDNLIILCNRCNTEKGALLDPRFEQTKILLDRLHTRWNNLHFPVYKKASNTYCFRTIPVKHDTNVYKFGTTKKVLQDIYKKQTNSML